MAASVIIIPVPEAEALVGSYRMRHTPSGRKGMPAHITLVAPFIDSDFLAAGAIRQVRDLLAGFGAFDFSLVGTAYFDLDGRRALYLVPTPGERFVQMAKAILAQFPYSAGNAWKNDMIPHLTVATSTDDDMLLAIEREVKLGLPCEARADTVSVMEEGEQWHLKARIELGGSLASTPPPA